MTTHQELLRTLESTRQRLQSTSNTLAKTRSDLEIHDPLPAWPSLLNSLQLAQHNLLSLQAIHTSAQPALQAAHVYPLPGFPGRTQEDLLGQLLRKKLQPGVEDWIDDGLKLATTTITTADQEDAPSTATDDNQKPGLKVAQLENLWDWAGPEANRIAREDIGAEGWDDLFTLAENEAGIENVVTGLRRKLWESDGEESDGEGDNEDKMDVDDQDKEKIVDHVEETGGLDKATAVMRSRKVDQSRAPLPLDVVLRFSLTGQLPTPGAAAQVRR